MTPQNHRDLDGALQVVQDGGPHASEAAAELEARRLIDAREPRLSAADIFGDAS